MISTYTVVVSGERQAGYDDQAERSGMSVQDNIQRIVDAYGDGYVVNMNVRKLGDLVAVIAASPDDNISVIETKKAAIIQTPVEEIKS